MAAPRGGACLSHGHAEALSGVQLAAPRASGTRCSAGCRLRRRCMRPQRAVHAVAGASARLSATPPPPSSRVRSGVAASERPRGRPPGRCTIAAASGGGTSVFIDAFNALPYELALLSAFAAGAAATAAVMTRESMLGLPLPPLPNAQRLAPAAAPDRIVTGSGVVVLQHLLNYFYPGLAAVLAIVITRRIQPGLERLQNATLREVRVEDLTLGDAPPLVNAVKLYDTAADKIIVELETVWDSKARLRLGVSFTEGGSLYAPVEVTGIRFQGVIRVIMAPMLLGPPFVGSMSFASALAPNIDFRIKVLGGEVSAIPGLREALQEYATSLLNATFTWPTRIVLPFRRARNPVDLFTVLTPEQVDDMRRCDYEELSETRVRSWGSRGLTRRMEKAYGAPGRAPPPPRRGVTSRVVDAVKGVFFSKGKRGAEEAAASAPALPPPPVAEPPPPPPATAPPPQGPQSPDAQRDAAAADADDAARLAKLLAARRAERIALWSPKPKRVGWLKRAWMGLGR